MKEAARAEYERGLGLYQSKDYAGAVAAFEAGYAIEPRREFLFAEAQAKRLAGDCRGAVPLYQQFLTTAPPEVQVNATHIALGRCAEQLAAARAEPQSALPPPPPPPTPPPEPPWYRDRLGGVLVGTGAVGMGLGAGFLAAAFSARDQAAATRVDYGRHFATAEGRWTFGIVALIGGGALAAGGVARYLWVRRHGGERVTLLLVPGALLVGGRF